MSNTHSFEGNLFDSLAPHQIGSQSSSLRILRLPDVIARVGLKRASIYLHIGKGTFPKPIALGPRAVGWLEHEIDEWLASRAQMRSGGKHAFSGSSAASETAVEDFGSRDI